MKAYKARDAKDQRRLDAAARNEAYNKLSLEEKLKNAGTKEKAKLVNK